MFSKGLPLPLAGLFGRWVLEAEFDGCSGWVGVGEVAAAEGLGDAGTDAGTVVELALAVKVEVDSVPVKTPEGPITIGIKTSKVLPPLSVVVLVNVELRVAVSSWPALLPFDVLCSGFLLLVASGLRVDCEGCSPVPETAA
jgi:hypothetical protein